MRIVWIIVIIVIIAGGYFFLFSGDSAPTADTAPATGETSEETPAATDTAN